MQKVLSNLRRLRDAFSFDELIVLGLVLSIFLTIYMTAVAVAAVLVYLLWQKKLLPLLRSTPGAFALPLFCLLALVVSLASGNAQGVLLSMGASVFFVVALYIRSIMTERLFEAVLTVSCTASLISVAVISGQLLASPGGVEIRAASTFMNANFYAAVIEFIILFCIYKISRTRSINRLFFISVLAANLAGLYMSNSRTAILSLGLAVMFYFAVSRRFKALIISATLAAAFIIIICQFPAMQERIKDFGVDLQDRVDIWQTAMRGIADSPLFGRGGGAYILTCIEFGGPMRPHAHNLIMELFLDYGVAGVLLLGFYIRENLKGINRLRERPSCSQARYLAHSAVVCVLLHGITDATVLSLPTGLLFALVMSLAGIRETAVRSLPVIREARIIRTAFSRHQDQY